MGGFVSGSFALLLEVARPDGLAWRPFLYVGFRGVGIRFAAGNFRGAFAFTLAGRSVVGGRTSRLVPGHFVRRDHGGEEVRAAAWSGRGLIISGYYPGFFGLRFGGIVRKPVVFDVAGFGRGIARGIVSVVDVAGL